MRTRFAPSPTGSLHVGGARTAIFNWLLARRNDGEFILRIDDTDTERSEEAHIEGLLDDLRWLGVDWDEGPDIGGDYGPYKQSERLQLYLQNSERLLFEGNAYRCYCTEQRLKELTESQRAASRPPRYDGKCFEALQNGEEPPEGVTPAIRFKVPDRKIVFKDELRGQVTFNAADISDFIIIGSDGIATYNFASAIDDSLMGITDVVRGEDHLSNTPRQILILQTLGLNLPNYLHLPLVVGPDRKPLSKRQEDGVDLTIPGLRRDGYFPEAVVNTLIRLGWAPREGYLEIEEMIISFQTERLSKSPAVFDKKVLDKYNRGLLKELDPEEVLDIIQEDLKGINYDQLLTIVKALKMDVNSTGEITRIAKGFMGEVEYTPEAEKLLNVHAVKMILHRFIEAVERVDELTESEFKDIMKRLKLSIGDQKLFAYIRAAITGELSGIELEKVAAILGKKKVLERAKRIS